MKTKRLNTTEEKDKNNCSDNILDDYIDAEIEHHKLWERARCEKCSTNNLEERNNILNTGKCSICDEDESFSIEEFFDNRQYNKEQEEND